MVVHGYDYDLLLKLSGMLAVNQNVSQTVLLGFPTGRVGVNTNKRGGCRAPIRVCMPGVPVACRWVRWRVHV